MFELDNIEIIDIEDILENKLNKLGYVIYIRKSTEEESKQIQSLEDQLISCFEYAEKKGIKLARRPNKKEFNDELTKLEVNKFIKQKSKYIYDEFYVILETGSAKKSYNRPKWRKIIEYIKKGKIKGILSYHPDRQARNLFEVGELIELYDQKLVDLKYSTFDIQNTPSGKMMLGILFVISKHFSDKLSLDVKRGVIGNLIKGKFKGGWKLYGYILCNDGTLKKDPETYHLIEEAYKMKIRGESNKVIIEYLNKNKLNAKKEDKNGNIKEYTYKEITNNILNRILSNGVYAGIVDFVENNTKKRIHLYKDYDINFPVIIDLNTFNKVQDIIKNKGRNHDTKKIDISPFFNGFFVTEEGKKCSFYISSKAKNKFYDLNNTLKAKNFFNKRDMFYKIQRKTNTYIKRKELGYKTNFSYKEIEDNIIIPALKKLNVEKTEEILMSNIVNVLENLIKKSSSEKKIIAGSINRYKGFLKEARKKQDIEKEKEYLIKINNLKKEEEIINKNINKVISAYVFAKDNIKDIKEKYLKYSYLDKRKILLILFDKLVVKGKYLILYTHSYLKYVFDIKTEIVIKKDL